MRVEIAGKNIEITPAIRERIEANRSSLVFTNSRRLCERFARFLNEDQPETKVVGGIASRIAIGIAIYGYIFLKEIPVRQSGFVINILFNNVTGLQPANPVTVSGVRIGRVESIELINGNVKVRAWVSEEVPLSRDTRAAIRSIGMIGDKYVELIPGDSAKSLGRGDTIYGEYISDLADAGGGLNELMKETTNLLGKLNTAVDSVLNEQTQKAMARTLTNTEKITTKLNRNLDRDMQHLAEVLAHLDTLSGGLKSYWQQNSVALDSAARNLSATTERLPVIVTKLDSTLTLTQHLLRVVENREGAVGKALYEDSLYVKANKSVDELNSILQDIKKNPAKYLQISVIDLF